jgi:uncharacterized protein GlcG (DUF336 family)
MTERAVLSLAEAMAAIEAVLAETQVRSGRPIAVAVVDHHGDLVGFACEAEANPALARQNAYKKAYTSACMRVDSGTFGERLKGQGVSVTEMGNPNFTGGAGGLVITAGDGTILGGLGVSGRPDGAEDEALAQAGKRALQTLLP